MSSKEKPQKDNLENLLEYPAEFNDIKFFFLSLSEYKRFKDIIIKKQSKEAISSGSHNISSDN